MGFLDDLKDGATDIGETVADGADTAGNIAYDTAEDLYESSSSGYDTIEDAAADMYSSTADYVYNEAGDALANPVETGEVLVDFAVGSDESPPKAVDKFADEHGYNYVGAASVTSICYVLSGITSITSLVIAGPGGAAVAMSVLKTGGSGCTLAGAVNHYGEDRLKCTPSDVFIYISYNMDKRPPESGILVVPWCT